MNPEILNIITLISIILAVILFIFGLAKKILKKVIFFIIVLAIISIISSTYSINLSGGDWVEYLRRLITPVIA